MYVADRHSWACNLSTYIKTPAPPLLIPSFHHIKTLHKQYTSRHPLLSTTTINTQRRPTSHQTHNQTTQWPPLPTTSPQWHQTTFLPAQDHHQHVLCLQFLRNRCGRLSNLHLIFIPSATACGASSSKSISTNTSDIQYTTTL
jgi:hypothetical protein